MTDIARTIADLIEDQLLATNRMISETATDVERSTQLLMALPEIVNGLLNDFSLTEER
jgi:hypothetical protein